MYCLATPIWARLKTLVMSNETHRNMDHNPGFAFIADGKRLRLFHGGTEVCRGQQQACKGNEVYRGSEAPTISQQIDQKDGGRRQGPGRSCWGGGAPCGESKVLGVQK